MLGLPSRATARLARERWPPLRLADDVVGMVTEVDRLDAPGDLGPVDTEHAAKKARFSVTLRSSYTLAAWVT